MSNSAIPVVPKRKTREDILESSIYLFAKFGYDKVTMREVAAEVGLTPAALYYHFSDKEQLYLDAMAYEFQGKSATLKEILDSGEPARVRLEAFVTGSAILLATNPVGAIGC